MLVVYACTHSSKVVIKILACCRCARLGLTVLAYLWRRDQKELLQEMIHCGVHAIIIKVAALGGRLID